MICNQCCKILYLQPQPLYPQSINEENQQNVEVQSCKAHKSIYEKIQWDPQIKCILNFEHHQKCEVVKWKWLKGQCDGFQFLALNPKFMSCVSRCINLDFNI
jgi:hypothetical protein